MQSTKQYAEMSKRNECQTTRKNVYRKRKVTLSHWGCDFISVNDVIELLISLLSKFKLPLKTPMNQEKSAACYIQGRS